MPEVKWIKISTAVFDNRKIRYLETMPDGDALIVIWFKLLCLAGNINDGGCVYFTRELPYTDEMLAATFNKPLKTVQMALKLFEQFGMIDFVDGLLHLSNWERYQNIEGMERIREQNRIRKQRYDEKHKALPPSNVTVTLPITESNATDIDKNKKRKDKNNVFVPPTLEEVQAYVEERGSNVDAQKFFDYYTAGNWRDAKGNAVKNWKQKLLTWERKDNTNGRNSTSNTPNGSSKWSINYD